MMCWKIIKVIMGSFPWKVIDPEWDRKITLFAILNANSKDSPVGYWDILEQESSSFVQNRERKRELLYYPQISHGCPTKERNYVI